MQKTLILQESNSIQRTELISTINKCRTPKSDGTLNSNGHAKVLWTSPKPKGLTRQSPKVWHAKVQCFFYSPAMCRAIVQLVCFWQLKSDDLHAKARWSKGTEIVYTVYRLRLIHPYKVFLKKEKKKSVKG